MDEQDSLPLIGCTAALALALVFAIVGAVLLGVLLMGNTAAVTVPAALEPTPATVLYRDSAPDPTAYTWQTVATGYDSPVLITHAGDGSGRIFGVEQGGKIWVIQDGRELPTPFLDISMLLSPDVMRGTYTERGLLGVAFHPDYAQNGQFFVSYTDVNGDSVLARYHVSDNPNRADAVSAEILLQVDQPYYDHNGGGIAFGNDGYLYIGFGDGGSVDDPHGNGQNPTALLGKMLRLDVDNVSEGRAYAIPADNPFVGDPRYAPEIYALGFRNPVRFAFDRATGDLYIGDVGQWTVEEVDRIPPGAGGGNYGWNVYEGDLLRAPEPVAADAQGAPFVAPILTFPHSEGCAVTGGIVYRGAALPDLNGVYFYGDYCGGRLWTAYRTPDETWHTSIFMETGRQITALNEDEAGELYLVDYKGDILRLVGE